MKRKLPKTLLCYDINSEPNSQEGWKTFCWSCSFKYLESMKETITGKIIPVVNIMKRNMKNLNQRMSIIL